MLGVVATEGSPQMSGRRGGVIRWGSVSGRAHRQWRCGVPSEAIGGLRAWARSRLGEQEEQLRLLERAVVRLQELEHERTVLLGEVSVAVGRLDELGVGVDQLGGFLGGDLSWLRVQGKLTRSTRASQTSGRAGS